MKLKKFKTVLNSIILSLLFLFVLAGNTYCEENKSNENISIEEKLKRMELILKELEKKQKALDVMSDLKQTEEEKKEEEEDILDAAGREYTLATPGTLNMSYSLGYTGDTYDQIRQVKNDDDETVTEIKHINTHNISNTLSLKVPILKNLTISSSIPYKFKFSESRDESKQGIGPGDPSVSIQYQPFKPKEGRPNTILNAGITFPLGSSPFKTEDSDEIATGNGYYSVSCGANFSKTIDPIIAYGGISYTRGFTVNNLYYNTNQEQKLNDDIYIYKVKPGSSIGTNIGMGYSLSYLVSISIGYQYTYSLATDYYWKNVGKNSSSASYSSSLSIGTNWKINHTKSINTNLNLGLFSNNSDVSFSMSIPFEFKI